MRTMLIGKFSLIALCVTFLSPFVPSTRMWAESVDIVVYGGTPSGVMAAVGAAREGKTVLLIEPNYFVGGLLAGGLTKTDIGRRDTVGGLASDFFANVQAFYDKTYGKGSTESKASKGGLFFEPHVAASVFEQMLATEHVHVMKSTWLISAQLSGTHIKTIVVQHDGGKMERLEAKMFVDSSYEGDLMASAGVPYRIGREAATEYGESLAGMNRGPAELLGKGDHRVQSYNIRSTLTNLDSLRVPIPKPAHYTPELYEGYVNSVQRKHLHTFEELFPDVVEWGGIRGKYDPNKADGVGVNYEYPEGTREVRKGVYNELRDQWLSFWYMLQNDPRLSLEFRQSAQRWGLPKDEFVESGNISPQLYVREARRMLGRYVLNQRDVQVDRSKPDGVCMGSYNMDSHDVQRILTSKGVVNEGFMIVQTDPYEIPYRSLTPIAPDNLIVTVAISATHIAYSSLRMEPVYMMLGQVGGIAAADALNEKKAVQAISVETLRGQLAKAGIPLHAPYRPVVAIIVDPATVSVKSPAHFSIGHSAVRDPLTKYYWNFDGSGAVQATDATPTWTFPVSKRWVVSLIAEDVNGVQSNVARVTLPIGDSPVDDPHSTFEEATAEGLWDRSAGSGIDYRGRAPHQDLNLGKGTKSVTFHATLPRAGHYRVAFAYPPAGNLASNVPLELHSALGSKDLTLNEREKTTPFSFAPLGEFDLPEGTVDLKVSNAGTNGVVVADEVRWIWLGTATETK